MTGDIDSDAFDYRRHEELENFFARFEDVPAWEDEGSRHTRALRFLTACDPAGPLGESRLPVAIESVLREMLNVGEFEDEAKRDAALAVVRGILESYRVAIETDFDGEVQIVEHGVEQASEPDRR